jgi:hypothetical protein
LLSAEFHEKVTHEKVNGMKSLGMRCILPVSLAFLAAAADDEPAWKSKQIAEWSAEDATQVLFDSPWAKTFTPTLTASQESPRKPGGIGRELGGVGRDAIGLAAPGGIPGIPGTRRTAGSAAQNGDSSAAQSAGGSSSEPPKLTLRWESAMPVRTAELKARDPSAPDIDESHYAIAVYGIPDRMIEGDVQKLGDQLKNEAFLKREGKKDLRPSGVKVFDTAAGRVVLYSFPMSDQITRADNRVQFTARIGRLDLDQSFFVDTMLWQGKLEL